MSGPALRALDNAGVKSLASLARVSEAELAAMHGMGPKGIRILKEALQERGLDLRKP